MTTSMGHPGAAPEHAARPTKASIRLAQRIVRDAVAAGLGPGSVLLSERAMGQRYHVSRATLREALRLLEFHGAIHIQRGLYGGPVLQEPDAVPLANTLGLLLQLKDARFRNLSEARVALEPTISRLAAERMDGAALAELGICVREARENVEDVTAFLVANRRFHNLVASSSGNPLFGLIVTSIGLMKTAVFDEAYPLTRRTAIVEAHEKIYEAILEHDGALAESRMRRHLDAYTTFADSHVRAALDRAVTSAVE